MGRSLESPDAGRRDTEAGRGGASLPAAEALCLAATPTFAMMAVMSVVRDGAGSDPLCTAAFGGAPIGSMAAMYLLMSLFHAPAWLRWVAARRKGAGGEMSADAARGARPHP